MDTEGFYEYRGIAGDTPLDTVGRLAADRRTIEREYRSALQAARDAGHSLATIAAAAGVSRQAVHAMTTGRLPLAR